jgi:mannan endo-1,4-beta-mannosidase
MMRRRLVCLTMVIALMGVVQQSASATSRGFVTRSGTQLYLDGRPYRFTGLNVYNANSTGSCWYAMSTGPILDDSLASMGAGNEAIRAWFFQSLATTNGRRDWSAFDHTLAVARPWLEGHPDAHEPVGRL